MASEEIKVLEDIRKLMIFILLKQGMKQSEIADALGVSQPTISRMFSKKVPNSQKSDKAE
jgi:predicted transcriptional regulator